MDGLCDRKVQEDICAHMLACWAELLFVAWLCFCACVSRTQSSIDALAAMLESKWSACKQQQSPNAHLYAQVRAQKRMLHCAQVSLCARH